MKVKAIKTEMRTIEAMVRIYCRDHHGGDLCGECDRILAYCYSRIEKCVYGPDKPACNQCTVHCYSPKMREQVKAVMRFSGPKMIYRHPYLAMIHLVKEKKMKAVESSSYDPSPSPLPFKERGRG